MGMIISCPFCFMKINVRVSFLLILLIVCYEKTFSQGENDTLLKNRLYLFTGATALTYGGTMFSLNQIWYSKYEHSSFHFFDDSQEWLQMDKVGHSFSTYYLSNICHKGFLWTGMSEKKSIIIGTSVSSLAMISIEIFDGFSSKWGASVSDVVANFCGGLIYAGQEIAFKKQVFRLKYSFHPSPWAQYRPDALGENRFQQIVKDYNGQTYWLSCNLKSITRIQKMPKWLNISFGYSGEEMLTGNSNLDVSWDIANGSQPVRYRQYLFSLDADLSEINVKNQILKKVLRAINCLKIPFPALILEKNTLKVNSLYF